MPATPITRISIAARKASSGSGSGKNEPAVARASNIQEERSRRRQAIEAGAARSKMGPPSLG